jgi:hypothetical protein
MGKKYQLEALRLLSLGDVGDEPFIAEVLVKDEDDEVWTPIEVRGRATFDPDNFEETFRVDIIIDDPSLQDLRAYLEEKLKEDFRELAEKI